MPDLEVITTNDVLEAYDVEEGDNGLFLLNAGDNNVGYVPYERLKIVRKLDE